MLVTSRIVVVNGPGGRAKSRVASELVDLAGSGERPNESRLVELASVRTAERVVVR